MVIRTAMHQLGGVLLEKLLNAASTSYVGAIETAEVFGPRIYAEVLRRRLRQADQVIVVGDGAPWIWGIATEYFPFAIQCVDLYHARQHLAEFG